MRYHIYACDTCGAARMIPEDSKHTEPPHLEDDNAGTCWLVLASRPRSNKPRNDTMFCGGTYQYLGSSVINRETDAQKLAGVLRRFAELHNLSLYVNERDIEAPRQYHFYAYFKNVSFKDGDMMRAPFGEGATEDDAVADYAALLSGKILIEDSQRLGRETRRIIQAPIFAQW
jgi:hypothetical protein